MSTNSVQDAAQQQSSRFLFVETLKILVYSASIKNEHTLHHPIFDACQTIQNRTGSFGTVRQSVIRRVRACVYSGGLYFEHLL